MKEKVMTESEIQEKVNLIITKDLCAAIQPGESEFLGTVMALAPSGKYWTCWASSNVNEQEQENDETFFMRLEEKANEFGCYTESGEGDPCDLFLCRTEN